MHRSPYELVKSYDENLWREGLALLLVERSLQALEAIISVLSDKVWKKREAAAKTLIEWGEEIIPHVVARISPSNLDECYWLSYVLGHFNDIKARAKLLELISSNDPEIRNYAIRALAINKSKENARVLIEHLNDQSWAIRRLVFEELLTFNIDDVLPLLRDLISDYSRISHIVIALFVKVGRENILEELKRLYESGNFAIRYSIVLALSEADFNGAIDFLIFTLSDKSWVIRKKSAEILVSFGTKVIERLSAWFSKGDSIMKYQIINIIVILLKEKALPILKKLIMVDDEEYKLIAIENLVKIPGDESTRLLIKCLSDKQRIVADYASECLAQKPNLNMDLLLENLEIEDENVRFLIIKTIGTIGGFALNPILKILETGNKQEKLFLLSVLQKVSPNEKIISVLINLLSDQSWPIRNAAANCLISYGEHAISAVVTALNSPNEDIQYWTRRILINMGPTTIDKLIQLLGETTELNILPYVISALLSFEDSRGVEAVLKFIQNSDDSKVNYIIEELKEISSREVVETILNLLSHPDERAVEWLSKLLGKVFKPQLKRIILLALNHPSDKCRYLILSAINNWNTLQDHELKSILRQLEIEKNDRNAILLAKILAKFAQYSIVENLKEYLLKCNLEILLDILLELAQSGKIFLQQLVAEILKLRSDLLDLAHAEKIGKILGVVYQNKIDDIVQGLTSTSVNMRLCSLIALENIKSKRTALAILQYLPENDEPVIIHRAVKILASYFFSDDFRLKGMITDFFLGLGKTIVDPLLEILQELENDVDRKAIIDIIESVGGQVEPHMLVKKGTTKTLLSDEHLDQVLEKRRKALEELQKYEKIIQEAHTQELSVMFTDVKGYTAFSSKASFSELISFLKQHDEFLLPIIQKHQGHLVKKIGDALLVVFEQPSKAVLAAIEMQRKLKEYNASVDDSEKLEIRISINTGPVIRREGDYYGDTINVASRMQSVADAYDIIISESTATALDSNIFNLQPYGEHLFKGKDKPLKIYKVIW